MPFSELAEFIAMHPWLIGGVCVSAFAAWVGRDGLMPASELPFFMLLAVLLAKAAEFYREMT
jgi:hypothetical protein